MRNLNRITNYLIVIIVVLCSLFIPEVLLADDSEWPQFQVDELNTGITTVTAPTESAKVAWSSFTHYRATHGIDVTPVVADNKVFVIDVNTCAWAFNMDTGEVVWNTALVSGGRFNLATPAYGEEKVFFATDSGYIYALDKDNGMALWSGRLTQGTGQEEELTTQLVYHDGKVYVGSWEGVYYCLDADGDGSEPDIIWEYNIEGKRYSWWSGSAIIGDFILFGDADSVITVLNKDSGNYISELNLSIQYGINAGVIRSAIITNAAKNRIYLTSQNGYLFTIGYDPISGSFNPADGWCVPIDNYSCSTPVLFNERLYVCSGTFYKAGGLFCLNEVDGSQVWKHSFGNYGSEASPAISIQDGNPYIYITTDTADGTAYCFNQAGDIQWEYLPDHPEYILQGMAIADSKVYFGNDAGYLYALEPCPDWDVNCNNTINFQDIILVGLHWGETGTDGWIREDVNNDGIINMADIIIIGIHWNE
jgi:outer membrane protein assembly factor BamB